MRADDARDGIAVDNAQRFDPAGMRLSEQFLHRRGSTEEAEVRSDLKLGIAQRGTPPEFAEDVPIMFYGRCRRSTHRVGGIGVDGYLTACGWRRCDSGRSGGGLTGAARVHFLPIW
jgi:hypothetical protein